jgi:hypothetical protein
MFAMTEPNRWTTKEAAAWAGIGHRVLLDLLNRRLLPAIPIGRPRTQKRPSDKKRQHRRVTKWVIPREAFINAWRTFTMPQRPPKPRRRNAA